MFSAKEGVHTHIRNEEQGFGHFTYTPSTGPVFVTGEPSMAKTLLELTAND